MFSAGTMNMGIAVEIRTARRTGISGVANEGVKFENFAGKLRGRVKVEQIQSPL